MVDPPAMEGADVVVVGAGAAGLLAALAARGALSSRGAFAVPRGGPRVLLLDGQAEPGRKILISGGGRCNVTNASVRERDFDTDAPAVVRTALREFPPSSIVAFLDGRGVPLFEEPLGKVFPRSGRARDVLEALQGAVREAGVACAFGREVADVRPAGDGGWTVEGPGFAVRAPRVIVATGGRSVPATGSRGFGYELARRLGHDLEPPVPALAALVGVVGPEFAGVTVPAILSVLEPSGRVRARAAGSLLFTHRGVSGPAALDVSGAVERAAARAEAVRVEADLWTLADPGGPFGPFLGGKLPGACLPDAPRARGAEQVEAALSAGSGRERVGDVLLRRLPRRVVLAGAGDPDLPLARLGREERRRIARAVGALDLRVRGTGGFARAEVTAGGVRLRELERRTFESSLAPGIHFCGEVCHATGRLGGFNFQWAWSSGFLAGACARPG
jgi:predicted flavoprotein YhiN